jgi:hypothetical protein
MTDIQAIRTRCEAVRSRGVWKSSYTNGRFRLSCAGLTLGIIDDLRVIDFIAHAREDIPALLDLVAEKDKRIAEVEGERDAAVEDLTEAFQGDDPPCTYCKQAQKECRYRMAVLRGDYNRCSNFSWRRPLPEGPEQEAHP